MGYGGEGPELAQGKHPDRYGGNHEEGRESIRPRHDVHHHIDHQGVEPETGQRDDDEAQQRSLLLVGVPAGGLIGECPAKMAKERNPNSNAESETIGEKGGDVGIFNGGRKHKHMGRSSCEPNGTEAGILGDEMNQLMH